MAFVNLPVLLIGRCLAPKSMMSFFTVIDLDQLPLKVVDLPDFYPLDHATPQGAAATVHVDLVLPELLIFD